MDKKVPFEDRFKDFKISVKSLSRMTKNNDRLKIKNDLRTQIVAELTALISTCTEISTPLHQHQSSWM